MLGRRGFLGGNSLIDHGLELFDKEIFHVRGLQDEALLEGQAREERQVHSIDGIIKGCQRFRNRGAKVLLESKQ